MTLGDLDQSHKLWNVLIRRLGNLLKGPLIDEQMTWDR